MKTFRIRHRALTIIVAFIGALPVTITSVHAGEAQQATPEAGNEQQAMEKINKALQDAAKHNSSTVTIDLDDTGRIAAGDLVRVNYTASLENGTLLGTTLEKVAGDPARKKAEWFKAPEHFLPVELIAGKEELIPGLAGALPGMGPGEKKHLVVPPEMGFGAYDPQKKSTYPTTRNMPRTIEMGADEYGNRFHTFPVVGKDVDLVPYFKARVTKVDDREATLEFLAKDGARFDEGIGVTEVHVKGDGITTVLQPRIGADFMANGMRGKIVAVESGAFTVDYNGPTAGKPLILDLEVVSTTRAAEIKTSPIDWFEEQEKGLAEAKKAGKPLFLLLYADWCGWCKKTMTETLPDPRIVRLRDKFVWMRLNSDKEQRYKKQYGQDGFPMMVILKPDGTVLKKIDGYRNAAALKAELEGVL